MKSLIIGSVVLATDQGLGYLAKAFYDNGLVKKVLIHQHTSRVNHHEWYPDACKSEEELLDGLDVLLLFEEAWDWKIIVRARKKGIKTILMPMYECTRHPLPYEPDIILCPSLLDMRYYDDKNSVFLPVPVNVPWKKRSKALVFVHNAGNGGLGMRNGTPELLEAMRYVKSPIKLIVRTQSCDFTCDDPRVEIRKGNFPVETLWDEGDVFIFPEKFNGLSLPLQEAFASGMLVMAGDRFPMNTWLPTEPLIPVERYKKERIVREFESAVYDPKIIAETIDNWYGKDISQFSLAGREWGKLNSWDNLLYEYISTIGEL